MGASLSDFSRMVCDGMTTALRRRPAPGRCRAGGGLLGGKDPTGRFRSVTSGGGCCPAARVMGAGQPSYRSPMMLSSTFTQPRLKRSAPRRAVLPVTVLCDRVRTPRRRVVDAAAVVGRVAAEGAVGDRHRAVS